MQRCRRWALASVVFAVVFGGALLGCDRDPSSTPPSEPPLPPRVVVDRDASLEALLGMDAEVAADPPPPPGDLKTELDAFTTLDGCVTSRAAFDSVVGDAIDAIGYDSLQRDACRVLQAVKARDTGLCEPIASSSLRTHCVSSVAIVAADETMCPLVLETHEPLCVALARRDARLCTTVLRDERAMCRAILARDAKRCEGSKNCERLVTRWRGLIGDAAQGPELGTRITMTVTGPADGGDGKARTFDLSKDVGPATVRKGVTGANILIGDTTTMGWPPAMIAPDARVSIVLAATASTTKQGRHAVDGATAAFVMLAPKVATMMSEGMEGPAMLNVDLVGLEIGSPVRFTLEAKMAEERGGYHVRLEVNTFVRDVVTVGR